MNENEIKELLQRYTEGLCTPDEIALVETWFNALAEAAPSKGEIVNYHGLEKEIWTGLPVYTAKRSVKLWPRIAAAAALVVAIFGAGLLYYSNQQKTDMVRTVANDVAPGRNGATITLASGKVIKLSDRKSGVVIGNNKMIYDDGSQLSLQGESLPEEERMLTASTSKGQTYQFTLPDGTKVWLNADSKISFPSQFSGAERKILLSGEAYFAVVHNAKQPFRVESDGQVVEDIGTEFNINAYTDESSTKTTLIEGSAKVNTVLLKPNQQAILTPFGGDGVARGGKLNVVAANTEEVTAWKNGYFRFNDEHIESIMKQLARWYNIEVVYEGKVPTDGFNGKVSRYKNISQVLKALEAMKIVHFKVEGRRVTVIE